MENKNKLIKMIKKDQIDNKHTKDLLLKCLQNMSYGQVNDMVAKHKIDVFNPNQVDWSPMGVNDYF
tara:strand:+ start:578 stop:775 length:198 start_codon:yes stop_codon:yes gene_type:complete